MKNLNFYTSNMKYRSDVHALTQKRKHLLNNGISRMKISSSEFLYNTTYALQRVPLESYHTCQHKWLFNLHSLVYITAKSLNASIPQGAATIKSAPACNWKVRVENSWKSSKHALEIHTQTSREKL